jgi:hypothetical protein
MSDKQAADIFATLLDRDALRDEPHLVSGVHAELLEVLRGLLSEGGAREIMQVIADRGGLHRMSTAFAGKSAADDAKK